MQRPVGISIRCILLLPDLKLISVFSDDKQLNHLKSLDNMKLSLIIPAVFAAVAFAMPTENIIVGIACSAWYRFIADIVNSDQISLPAKLKLTLALETLCTARQRSSVVLS